MHDKSLTGPYKHVDMKKLGIVVLQLDPKTRKLAWSFLILA